MRKIVLAAALVLAPIQAFAWDGFDYQNGTSIEIDKGNLVREGAEIEYFDYSAGEYKTGTVENISRFGSSVEIEVEDNDSGETRTFDMDRH